LPSDKLYSLAEVMKNPMRAHSFGQPVAASRFPAAVAPILAG